MFTKVAADLAGVQLTKSELDVADMVVQANIVNHPKPTQAEDITTIEADQRKKKDCCSESDAADMVVQVNIVSHPKFAQAEDITTIEAAHEERPLRD
eukprot:gene17423-26783_t